MDCSIIIVNYNTKNLTTQTINSINRNTIGLKYEIIVIDNSSNINERYASELLNIETYHVENKGFGNACNIGAKYAKGKYLLFLNSDTIVLSDTILKCINYIESKSNMGILGCKITLENGELDHGCKRGFPNPLSSLYYFMGLDRLFPANKRFGAYRLLYLDANQTHKVDSVSGAFMLMQKDLFEKVKGFDEDFFMYGEDLDLCFRVKELGLDVIYYSGGSITHLKGQSGLRTSSKKTIFHFYDAMLIFYRKHYLEKYSKGLYWVVFVAVKFKYLLTILGRTSND